MGDSDSDDLLHERTQVGDRAALLAEINKRAKQESTERAYMVVIAGPDVGEMFPVGMGGLVGRGDEVAIRLTDTEASRNHAQVVVSNQGVQIRDLGSTNGTFVNDVIVQEPQVLQDGDRVQIGTTTILKFSYQDAVEENFQRRMYESALRDGLTGAFNKAHFDDRLATEFAFASRHGTVLSLLLLDIDHFKKINDEHGHLAGDYVLSKFGKTVGNTIRKEDLFARYGGEEFAIISRGGNTAESQLFAERIRKIVESCTFAYDGADIKVTVSIGIATCPKVGIQSATDLIAKADKALYAAKNGGRNRVEVSED